MTTIYAYPWLEQMSKIRQPLLILVTHDYLLEPTRASLASAPKGVTVVDVPLEPAREAAPTGLYSNSPEVMAAHLRAFFS
jgi:hypothetical protein